MLKFRAEEHPGMLHCGVPWLSGAGTLGIEGRHLVAADFLAFVDAQERVAQVYRDRVRWTRMSILNTARSGKFSTDRTMEDYNAEIWKLTPVRPAL